MMKHMTCALTLILISHFIFAQTTTESPAATNNAKDPATSDGPVAIVRNIIQDKKGIIWIAAFDGVFRYDGKSFTNVTKPVSNARFFSALQDKKGNLWFGTIGSGVYRYDGTFFQNFTTKDGLLNNEVGCIYEDKAGNIWFGVNGGATRYDGKTFANYSISGDSIIKDETGKTFPDFTRPPKEVTSIAQDKTGKLWFGTRGRAFIYDGKSFITVTHEGKQFINVRTIMHDSKGNIWLAGSPGLWRYDGKAFTNINTNFVGYVYEDRKGNIWTSSETNHGWMLTRYEAKTLYGNTPASKEINARDGKMLFGILEASDGSIWFGADGVYRYDGTTVTDFQK
ncbi:MAG: two-component regulator propeller domain-containing protein [Chryseolinea sp.]